MDVVRTITCKIYALVWLSATVALLAAGTSALSWFSGRSYVTASCGILFALAAVSAAAAALYLVNASGRPSTLLMAAGTPRNKQQPCGHRSLGWPRMVSGEARPS
jgi:hypothetical protein